jgi:hypothetical protein
VLRHPKSASRRYQICRSTSTSKLKFLNKNTTFYSKDDLALAQLLKTATSIHRQKVEVRSASGKNVNRHYVEIINAEWDITSYGIIADYDKRLKRKTSTGNNVK